ncbi:MAG: hypothetical protein AAGJ40_09925 [Planctomycetota bacterium]
MKKHSRKNRELRWLVVVGRMNKNSEFDSEAVVDAKHLSLRMNRD